MSEHLTPIYEQDPARLEALHDRLNAVPGSFQSGLGEEPVRHTAHFNEWAIALDISETGELQSASLLRAGTIPYNFARTDDGEKTWAAVDASYRFPEAHFSNLVTLATRDGLKWIQSPEAGPNRTF